MHEATIKVQGMTCNGCVNSVTMAIKAVPGVTGAVVSLEKKEAKVQYDERAASLDAIITAVNASGYTATE